MQAQIYIVRIYRRNGETDLAGVVEVVRNGERRRFRSVDQLCQVLDLPPNQRSRRRGRRR